MTLSLKKGFRTLWGHMTASNSALFSMSCSKAVFCACWLYSDGAAHTQPWSAVMHCKHIKLRVLNKCTKKMMEAEFFPHKSFALEVLDTKTKCNISRPLTGSCILPFFGYRYGERTLLSVITHIQILTWFEICLFECHMLIFGYILFCIKQNEDSQAWSQCNSSYLVNTFALARLHWFCCLRHHPVVKTWHYSKIPFLSFCKYICIFNQLHFSLHIR